MPRPTRFLRFYLSIRPDSERAPGLKKKKKGYTLIEVIASLMILGILGTFLTVGVTQVMQGFVFTRDNADTSLSAQVVLGRLSKEFKSIRQVTSAAP